MSVYNAHRPSLIGLPMEPLKGDAVERMSIGTLDEPDEAAAARRRQRRRVAAGACALLFAATLALRVAAAPPARATTDSGRSWDPRGARAATAAAGGALAPSPGATYAGGCPRSRRRGPRRPPSSRVTPSLPSAWIVRSSCGRPSSEEDTRSC